MQLAIMPPQGFTPVHHIVRNRQRDAADTAGIVSVALLNAMRLPQVLSDVSVCLGNGDAQLALKPGNQRFPHDSHECGIP